MSKIPVILALLTSLASFCFAQEPVLTRTSRAIPGVQPTQFLQFRDEGAGMVEIAGIWSKWGDRHSFFRNGDVWQFDVSQLRLRPGRHEYKFILDGQWEVGENRELYVDDNHLLIRPPDLITKALQESNNEVLVYLRVPVENPQNLSVKFESGLAIKELQVASTRESASKGGYVISGNTITFVFDPASHGIAVGPNDKVAVAGNFNYWTGNGGPQGLWRLKDKNGDNLWELDVTLDGLRKPPYEPDFVFRFVINNEQWLNPPADAFNVISDASGNRNFRIDPGNTGSSVIKVITEQPIPLDQLEVLVIEGLADRKMWQQVTPGSVLNTFVSGKPLGAILNREQNATTYRLFAPRASAVDLCLFDTPEHEVHKPTYQQRQPRERYPMWRDPVDGVWEITLVGLDIGQYYSFNISGPLGHGEGFNPNVFVSDPWGLASAHAENNTIVMDPYATNKWFGGWTDTNYVTPALEDLVVYEAHLRDLTMHPSSKVPAHLRGKYAGLLATEGTGTGLDHLKDMGVNAVEFLPLQEFNNGAHEYNWGYTTVHYFAPEASFAREPLKGSQVYEFKNLVNEMHRRGLAVLVDVVYNHVGWPNIFAMIDRKYYFRLTADYDYLSFSGVGNDFKTETPMARRFVVESIKYWVREFKVDGFRWDLAELIDMETLMEAKREAEKINPRVIMISEPWSFRGNHKQFIRGTGWAAWNDDFRYTGKDFARGRANRDHVKKVIKGSTDIWTASPLQSVNYVESHDDMALADVLSMRPDKDGRNFNEYEAKMNRLAATMVFTSLGIPMINEGQEFIRSKRGISNTYNQGDGVNAIDWNDRTRPMAAETMNYYRDLIRMRTSDQGKAFRVRQTPPDDYMRWIDPPNQRLLGFIINSPRIHAGNGFVVLMNSDNNADSFEFELPAGRWRVVGDGSQINLAGLDAYPVMDGQRMVKITVPEVRALILMDGF